MTSATDIKRPRFARMYLKAAAARRPPRRHRAPPPPARRTPAARVVELGAGNGLNFAHYPPTVTEVIAIEPEPDLRAAAERGRRARRRHGHACCRAPPTRCRSTDGEMDAAVASLVLCSVPDQASALAELHRVLRPGGELRFYEHVIPRASRSGRSCSWPTAAASGRRSLAAATPPATQAPPSRPPASRSRRPERFGFSAGRSSRACPTSSASRGGPDRR